MTSWICAKNSTARRDESQDLTTNCARRTSKTKEIMLTKYDNNTINVRQ